MCSKESAVKDQSTQKQQNVDRRTEWENERAKEDNIYRERLNREGEEYYLCSRTQIRF